MFSEENNLNDILFLVNIIIIILVICIFIYIFSLLKKAQIAYKNNKRENYSISNIFLNNYKQKISSYTNKKIYTKNGYQITEYNPMIYVIDNVIDLSICDNLQKLIDDNKVNIKKDGIGPGNNVECYRFHMNKHLEYKKNYI